MSSDIYRITNCINIIIIVINESRTLLLTHQQLSSFEKHTRTVEDRAPYSTKPRWTSLRSWAIQNCDALHAACFDMKFHRARRTLQSVMHSDKLQ